MMVELLGRLVKDGSFPAYGRGNGGLIDQAAGRRQSIIRDQPGIIDDYSQE
ncbi:hypothetical protein [Mesorhizobium salmacidum]|uniref:Uncharacterized protein n=1 Tax=Mesorhizobium salmacidum TaxID=3015171 RepID=A0ABU8KVZ3_9HYPH